MNHRTLFFILFFLIMQPVSAIGQSLERQPEYQPSSDCITIDGRTYKLSPEFRIPSGIDIDSPVKLNFDDDTHELLSIERLVEDYSTGNSLEYHFGIVNAISKPGIDLSYRVYVDGIGYLFNSDTRIDEKAGFLDIGRAAPYPGASIIRYIEKIPDYDRPDKEVKTVMGLYQSQDSSKIIISSPDGEIEGLFYPGTRMSKTFYSKGTPVRLEMAGDYVKTVADYPLYQSGGEIMPINGTIEEIIRFSEKEVYIVSSNITYFLDVDVRYVPDRKNFEKGAPFAGLIRNGKVILLYLTENNRIKTINGSASSVIRNADDIMILVGGVEYRITSDSVVTGNNLVRHSEILGYADSVNNIIYMSFTTPWYSMFKDWNWTVIIPAVLSGLSLLFFLLLHRTKTEGFLQEVNGNIITLTDSKGDHKRHFRCTDEIAGYVSSLVTMKVELTVNHGKVIHIRYDF